MSLESNTTIPDQYLPLLEAGQVITFPIVTVLVSLLALILSLHAYLWPVIGDVHRIRSVPGFLVGTGKSISSLSSGFYVLLFGLCIYVLRQGGLHRKLYISWTSALFVLSTFMVIVETTLQLHSSTGAYLFVKDRAQRSLKHQKISLVLS